MSFGKRKTVDIDENKVSDRTNKVEKEIKNEKEIALNEKDPFSF